MLWPFLEVKKYVFEMAAMPFLCNEVLLDHFNLPRVIQVVFQMYRNVQEYYTSFPLPIFNFLLVVSINIKLRPDKYNSSNNREVVLTEVHASVKNLKFKNPRKVFQSLNNTYSRHCSLVLLLGNNRAYTKRKKLYICLFNEIHQQVKSIL